jgi:ABC-type branched-subunit amino acid transport system substrate-binding protein
MLGITACGSSKSTSSNGNSNSTTTVNGATLPTLPAPDKVTGTLSGPGVTASTITIGQITTISGPVPGLFQGANDGLDAWVDWINDNGGIDGRQVKVDHVDDAFNCTTYTNAMKHFATSVFAVVGNLTLEDTCGKSVLAANPNLVDIQALSLDPTLYSVPNAYSGAPQPPGGITTGLQYMKQKFPTAVTKAGELVGQAAAANGKEELLTAESVGYHYIYVQDIPDLTTNFTSYILKMKSQGVQFVDMTSLAVTSAANFLQQAAQQNYHPKVLYSASAYDAQLFKLLGKASLANNVVWSALPDALYLGQDRASNPAVNTFLNYLPKARANATSDLFAVEAWSAADLMLTAMQKAGSSITPQTVLSTLPSITSYNAGGLVGQNDPGQKQGTHCVVIANVQNGQWVRVDPTGTGFDCSGTYHSVSLSQISS